MRSEDGLSFIEVTVAFGIVMLILLSLAYVMGSGLKTAVSARQVQQSTQVANRAVEAARNAPYDELVMRTSDLSGDPNVGAGNTFDPDGPGLIGAEPLVHSASGGALTPHVTTEQVGSTSFTVRRYASFVPDAGDSEAYKRFTVLVQYPTRTGTQTQRTQTLIARARRGLGTAVFEVTPTTKSQTVGPGTRVTFAHSITNQGTPDVYDLTMPAPAGKVWPIAFYKDVDASGSYDASVDTLLGDTNGNSTPDTGSTAPSGVNFVLASWIVPAGEGNASHAMTFTARSGFAPTVTKTASDTVVVSNAGQLLYLHNNPSPPVGDTTATANLLMNTTAPAVPTLFRYSSNHYSGQPGRVVDESTPVANQADDRLMANWVFQAPSASSYSGNVIVDLFVANRDFSCGLNSVSLTVYVRDKAGAAVADGTLWGSQTVSSTPSGGAPCGFRSTQVSIPIGNKNLALNRFLELKVVANTGLLFDPALLAYDTTLHASSVRLPKV